MKRRIGYSIMTVIFVCLSASSLLGRFINQTPISRLDGRAESHIEKAMARAAYTFTVVRGLNGIVSVLQGTEIAVSPAGLEPQHRGSIGPHQ